MLSKNVNNKKCALILQWTKKNKKDADDFLRRKLTLNVKFWQLATTPILQIW